MKLLRSLRIWSLGIAVALLIASCLQDIDPIGAPCRDDSDCWSTHFCVKGRCYATATPEIASQDEPEPAKEAAPPEEPTTADEPTAPDEPKTEPAQEPSVDADAGPETPVETPMDQPTSSGGTRSLYQTCAWYNWALAVDRCKDGLVCHRVDAVKAYCLKDCSQAPNSCEAGSTCRLLSWTTTGQAVRACVTEKDEKGDCDPSRGSFCKRAGPNPSVCRNKICVATRIAREGENCDPAATAPVICDLNDRNICNNKGLCARATPKFEGDPCQNDFVCPKGLACSKTINNSPICLRECTSDKECEGSTLVSQSKCYNGVCVQVGCAQDFDCSFKTLPHLCRPEENKPNRCLPTFSGGERTFGEICAAGAGAPEKEGCSGTLRCFSYGSGAKYGICLTHCQDDFDCNKHYPAGGFQCSRTPSRLGFRYCQHPCDTAQGVVCPSHLTCNNQFRLCTPKE